MPDWLCVCNDCDITRELSTEVAIDFTMDHTRHDMGRYIIRQPNSFSHYRRA